MLESVEWGEFRFDEIFTHIKQGRRLKKEDHIAGNIPFVMAGVTNTGVVGFISNPIARFPKNSITMDIFGNTFYRPYEFGAGDDTGVYWNEKENFSSQVLLFLAIAMQKAVMGKFSYGKKLRSSKSRDLKMELPTKNGELALDFMENFVAELEVRRTAELEVRRTAELEAYLSAAGLKDCTLTAAEQSALADLGNVCWQSFNLKQLFGKATRGKRLKSDDRISGSLPFVTAGEADTGVSAFIGNQVDVFKANTVTIDMFGSAKYRNYEYGGDDHIAVVHTDKLPQMAVLFLTAAIHKASYTGKFHYGHNFYAKDADELNIMLPEKNGKPDYDFMQTLLSAVQKTVIQDVVEYTDRKIAATKTVIRKS